MKHWFKDQHFRSVLKNTSYLAVSRVVAALASLAMMAFTARGLGLILCGTLILISSYVQAANGLSRFQSWQLVVRYGGHGLANDDPGALKTSVGFAVALDLLSGFGGMIIAILALPYIAGRVGIDRQYLWLAILYCTLLPVMNAAAPGGALRVLDRFDLISWSDTVTPITRAILCAGAFVVGAQLTTYVVIWYLTSLVGSLYVWYLAWRELKRQGLLKGIRPTLRPTRLEGAWRFAIHINLSASVAAVWGPIARLVIGGLLGPAGAALFRVASTMADAAQKPADMLAKAFYPEVVRMDFSSKKPWKLMLRTTALISGVAMLAVLVVLFGGKPLIGLIFGKAFVGAYEPLLILIAVPLLGIVSFPLMPMLYALGRSDGPLIAKIAGSLVFFLAIAPLSWGFGINGAASALVLANAVNVAWMMWTLRSEHRRVRGT